MPGMRRREFVTLLGGAVVAARPGETGAGAAAGDAGDRFPQQCFARSVRAIRGGIPKGPERSRLCRGAERGHRISLGRRPDTIDCQCWRLSWYASRWP